MEAAQEKTNVPGLLMMIVGAINALFWLAWIGWGIFLLATGGLVALLSLPQILENGDVGTAIWAIWGPLVNTCTCGVNVVLLFASLIMAFGGLKLRGCSGGGTVKLGIIAGVLGPVLSIVMGILASLASFACCGLVFGQLPTVIVLLINAGIGGFAWMTMGDEEVAAAFEANDG